jgi:hypothetical protein
VGILFILVAIFDVFFYVNYPSQANIFVGESTRTHQEKILFDYLCSSIADKPIDF